ncbi:hypothetical protein T484DRAFT_2401565, partial [Baffinella frigidus]
RRGDQDPQASGCCDAPAQHSPSFTATPTKLHRIHTSSMRGVAAILAFALPVLCRATPAPHAPALAFSSPFPLSALPALGGTSARPRSLCVSGVRAMSARGGNSEGASRKGGAQKPSKICVTCQRPFEWRKKWERCWDEVTTCSKRCNAERRLDNKAAGGSDKTTGGSKDAASGDDDDDEDNALINSEFRNCDDRASSSGSSDDARAEDKKTEDRKALKKAAKLQKREKREGRAPETTGQKDCGLCAAPSDLLIRCTVDEAQKWHLVCGKCWTGASGGVTDGDAAHPHYRYGGLWKNRYAVKAQAPTGVPHS